MEIHITLTHIFTGESGCPYKCPIGLAIKEQVECERHYTMPWAINIDSGRYITSPELNHWIKRFDSDPKAYHPEITITLTEGTATMKTLHSNQP